MLLFLVLCGGLAWLVRSQENEAQTVMQQDDGHARSPSEPDEGGELEIRWVPPAKDVDPACGRTVTTDKAKPSIYAGKVYYFCSRECREVFEAAPQLYVGGGDTDARKWKHSHA